MQVNSNSHVLILNSRVVGYKLTRRIGMTYGYNSHGDWAREKIENRIPEVLCEICINKQILNGPTQILFFSSIKGPENFNIPFFFDQ
jgi:hypothetical protein